jgi:RHS repeat-associated protein
VLEEDISASMQDQYVWSPVYIDALIERETPTLRVYVQTNLNYNVTSIISTVAAVLERYIYDPYGQPTVLAPDWSARGTSSYAWIVLFQSGRYDTVIALYYFRNRVLSPAMGRWMENDPAGFKAGDDNLYRYLQDDPISRKDPLGLWEYRCRNLAGIASVVSVVGGLVAAQFVHCWVECGGHSYSLLNIDGTATPTPDADSDIGQGTVIVSGSDRGGVCDCIKKNYEANKEPYDYSKSNCNSNWWAFHLLSCCVCRGVNKGGGADYGYGNKRCKGREFKCVAGSGQTTFNPKYMGANEWKLK